MMSENIQQEELYGAQRKLVGRPWLSTLKKHMLDATEEAACEIWRPVREGGKPYFNYRLEHIRQVERDAFSISAVVQCDMDVLLAAVWAHDRFQPQFTGENHAVRAAEWAADFLKFARFPEHKIPKVCLAVRLHTAPSMEIPEELREARALWDADHVSRMGPMDVMNYVLCHTAGDFIEGLEEDERFPDSSITMKDFVPQLMEHRPQLFRGDWFYYEVTRRMASERITASRAFLDCLDKQTRPDLRMAQW